MPESGCRELPVEELLPRARPLPPHEEMAIIDLDDVEGTERATALAAWLDEFDNRPAVAANVRAAETLAELRTEGEI